MSSQIRRSAASIAANIAEGWAGSRMGHSFGFCVSLKELETHLILVERVQMAPSESVSPLLVTWDALGKMLRRLIQARQTRAAEA
jgi:four helix bundle protein